MIKNGMFNFRELYSKRHPFLLLLWIVDKWLKPGQPPWTMKGKGPLWKSHPSPALSTWMGKGNKLIISVPATCGFLLLMAKPNPNISQTKINLLLIIFIIIFHH
jgi:hypothetical protein